jgi:hypothetical protein
LAAAEFRRGQTFQQLVLRYIQTQFIQSAQTAGCNSHHTIEQRLARWILLCHDRVEGPIEITQDFIAMMLGNRRSSVSIEAGKLQKLGLIGYGRGRIIVTNRLGLEAKSCECYAIVRNNLEHYTNLEWDLKRSAPGRSRTQTDGLIPTPLLSSPYL